MVYPVPSTRRQLARSTLYAPTVRRLTALLLLGAALLSMPAVAEGPAAAPIEGGATATATAVRLRPAVADIVTVNNAGELTAANADAALAAARDAGAAAAIGRSASIGMVEVRRGAAGVQIAPSGFAYPMGVTVLPLDMVASTMGPSISASMTADTVVMGQLTASLRGATAGDTITLVAANGSLTPMTVALIGDDAVVGGTELLMSPAAADRLGIVQSSSVVIWNLPSRGAIDAALSSHGLINTKVRIRRSWEPFDPDFTIGMARTKQALGEFAYRVNANGSVTLDSTWLSTYITYGSIQGLRLSSGCNAQVRPALQAAMDEVVAAGLAGTINYADANSAGGCFGPRFNRLTPDSSVGFLSRHTWGQAVDTNTQGSCQGCAPPDMNCATVRIFRKHGFAWGGNFLVPDGMHFEWVGEPRDQYSYPSRFCPNAAADGAPLAETQTQRATFFASDGMIPE